MQTSYSLNPPVAYAGDLSGGGLFSDLVFSRPAAETIPFGVLVEHQADDTFRVWRGTGKVAGVSMRRMTRMSGATAPSATAAYLQYDQVPVLRRGRIWAQFESNAVSVAHVAPNLWVPTTNGSGNLAKLGFFTSRATSATVGQEISATPAASLHWAPAAAADTIAQIECDFGP